MKLFKHLAITLTFIISASLWCQEEPQMVDGKNVEQTRKLKKKKRNLPTINKKKFTKIKKLLKRKKETKLKKEKKKIKKLVAGDMKKKRRRHQRNRRLALLRRARLRLAADAQKIGD